MMVEVAIVDISENGVRVRLTDGATVWLPRRAPGLTWSSVPESGDVTTARLPRWLINKHVALRTLAHQRSLAFHQPSGLGPTAHIEGSFPVTEQTNERRGALFREIEKKSEKAPDMTGHLTLGGVRYRLAGWTREDKNGRKYLSIIAEPPKDQSQAEQQHRQQPGAGILPAIDDAIPF